MNHVPIFFFSDTYTYFLMFAASISLCTVHPHTPIDTLLFTFFLITPLFFPLLFFFFLLAWLSGDRWRHGGIIQVKLSGTDRPTEGILAQCSTGLTCMHDMHTCMYTHLCFHMLLQTQGAITVVMFAVFISLTG